jgi:hypothetical protein
MRRTRASRATTGATRRRASAVPEPVPNAPPATLGPISLYRAEKARRASNVDAAIMAEAKKASDELVAEQGAKRAGMRSSVVSVARRGRKPAPKG